MENTAGMQKKLEGMRREILARTGAVERDLRRKPDQDSQERATERENDRVLEELDEGGRREIGQIELALARIEQGTYGTCDACGAGVGAPRLEALPFATSCIDCARSAPD